MITEAAEVAALQTTTQALLASLRQFPPMMPNVNGTVSWFDVSSPALRPPSEATPPAFDNIPSAVSAVLTVILHAVKQWSLVIARAKGACICMIACLHLCLLCLRSSLVSCP